jgi:hypothetical protein
MRDVWNQAIFYTIKLPERIMVIVYNCKERLWLIKSLQSGHQSSF